MREIRQCPKCDGFTLKEECCGEKTESIVPPRYSPEEKHADLKRKVKEPKRKAEGLL